MGRPRKHIPVKFITGLISSESSHITRSRQILEEKFGKVDRETPLIDFSYTRYYEREFGSNLKRKFLSFERLIALEKNHRIKLRTNWIEKNLSVKNRRAVNIDPGYITLEKLVLFTTKNGSHRIHLGSGIYADLELVFEKKTFRPLDWTYPDYRTGEYINFFNSVRDVYFKQIKGMPCLLKTAVHW